MKFTLVLGLLSNAQTIATFLAGIVAPLFVGAIKKYSGWRGKLLYGITMVVSVLLALAALGLSGDLAGWSDLAKSALAILALATTVYKLVAADAPTQEGT